jgi:hypothetical protein
MHREVLGMDEAFGDPGDPRSRIAAARSACVRMGVAAAA